jgi:hypothetical protein
VSDKLASSPCLWNRQAWDTDKSYAAFRDYYLVLDRKHRSLSEAYRRYALKTRGKPVRTNGKSLQPNGLWQQWFRGQDSKGKRPAGTVFENAVCWEVRARAWDDHQDRLWEDEWLERRRRIREEEWESSMQLLQRAKQMLAAPLFIEEIISEDGKTIIVLKPTKWRERDIVRLIDLAFKLAHRAIEMETEHIRVDDWRAQLAAAGFNPDQALEHLANALAAQSASDAFGLS